MSDEKCSSLMVKDLKIKIKIHLNCDNVIKNIIYPFPVHTFSPLSFPLKLKFYQKITN